VIEQVSQHPGQIHDERFQNALECLSKGRQEFAKNLSMRYPADGVEHYQRVHKALKQYIEGVPMHSAAGYDGPWIENRWILQFSVEATRTIKETGDLKVVFGPYIPLFIPWVDLWLNANPTPFQYPRGFVNALKDVLDPNTLYVTVSQSALGIRANEVSPGGIQNILVFSAGGNGHVPIPLLKSVVPTCPRTNIYVRRYFLSFAGSLENGAYIRHKMKDIAQNFTKGSALFVGQTSDWLNKTCETVFTLSPRGTGRTSYRLFETIQAGRIPIYIYTEPPWVPYRDMLQQYIWLARVEVLETVLQEVRRISDKQVRLIEEHFRRTRDTHFTYEGVLQQISMFLTHGEISSDLRCEIHPNSTGFLGHKG